jgi:hypothetical protein
MKTLSKQAELEPRRETLPAVITVQDEDFEPPTHVEAPIVPFVQIRQKPLVSEQGETLRNPGGFSVSDPGDADADDVKELHLAILDNRVCRVYFENLTDTQPVCKSNDGVHGSRPREGDCYETCATCALSFFGDSRPRCREGRNVFAFDLLRERFVVFTFSPSGLKPWRAYQSVLEHYAREKGLARADGAVPYVGHLLRTRVTSRHESKPAPHFAPSFMNDGELPPEIQERMRAARRQVKMEGERMLQAQQLRAGDYVASGNGQ